MQDLSEPAFHSALIRAHDFETTCRDYTSLFGHEPFFVGASQPVENGKEPARAPVGPQPRAVFALDRMHLEIAGGATEAEAGLAGIRFYFPSLEERRQTLAERGGSPSAPRPFRGEPVDAAQPALRWHALDPGPAATRGLDVQLVSGLEGWPDAEDPRRSEGPVAGSVSGLDHVVVMSQEIESTRRFYGDVLGLRMALDKRFEKRGLRLIFFRLGGVTVEVAGRLDAEPQGEAPDRFGGLAWQSPDVRALRTRLLEAGFDVSEVRDGHKPGTFVCTVRTQTGGVPTLLIQPVAREPV